MGNKKDRRGVIFSTDPEFDFEYDSNKLEITLPPEEQLLYISLDSKHRKGKVVTLVEGFKGGADDLKDLEKLLKTRCGVGGSSKKGCIVIQGPHQEKVSEILKSEGYRTKLKG